MSELNMSLEYLPITKELKDVSNFKKENSWLEQSGQDLFNNPRFNLGRGVSCTIQTSKDGKWYVAFVRISERINDSAYNNTYFKAFASREEYDEENNSVVYFDRFNEWEKEESTGRWVQKNN